MAEDQLKVRPEAQVREPSRRRFLLAALIVALVVFVVGLALIFTLGNQVPNMIQSSPTQTSIRPPEDVDESLGADVVGPDAPDLDVLYIERNPMYPRYRVTYFEDRRSSEPEYPGYYPYPEPRGPQLVRGEKETKRWPSAGDTVKFTAFVKNNGSQPTGDFDFRWFVDGIEVTSGTHKSIEAKHVVYEELEWKWPPTLDDHTVKFVVDPGGRIDEISESNNALEDYTNALSFRIHVARSVYSKFNSVPNLTGSYSFQDWVQHQAKIMNQQLSASVYPDVAPHGILERIRIDQIIVEEDSMWFFDGTGEHAPVDWDQDGRWGFSVTEWVSSDPQKIGRMSKEVDWALIHEWGHQIGLIDEYSIDVAHNNVLVRDAAGALISGIVAGPDLLPPEEGYEGRPDYPVYLFKYKDNAMMHHPGDFIFSPLSAVALNSNLHKRRGYFGEYLFDIPAANSIQVLAGTGKPLQDAQVEFYQRGVDGKISNEVAFAGRTDSNGVFPLPNIDGLWSQTEATETGHRLRPNPFGKIDIVGRNGTFLIRISKGNSVAYRWLEITEFNLAYWSGNRDAAVYSIKTNLN